LHLDAERPTVIAGDFNETARGRAVRWLTEEKGMRDALSPFDARSPTWHLDTGFARLSLRIDHVLVSPHFDCVAARVIPTPGSDHYPVVATLVRRAGN
jgi:endonuclease/exonuclease/phosphatase family metal-dependent hydrolase